MDAEDGKKRADISEAMKRYNLLRGILAIWIVFGHCSDYMTVPPGILFWVKRFNLVCVGIFFFLSGFGLEHSLQTKKGYLRFFLLRKCGGLFLMATVQYLVSDAFAHIMHWFLRYEDLADFLQRFVSSVNWFVWELMLFYLLFFLAALLIKAASVRGCVLLFLTVLMIAVFRRLEMGNSWYYSSLAFPAGMLLRIHKERLEKHFRFLPALLICVLPAALFGGAGFLLKGDGALSIYAKNLFCVFTALSGTVLLMKLPLRGRVLAFLAKISPEIFLYQFTAASIMLVYAMHHKWTERGFGFVLCNVLLTLILAPVFCGLRLLLSAGFRRLRAGNRESFDL